VILSKITDKANIIQSINQSKYRIFRVA